MRDRLGLPALSGRRSLAAALVADSLGDGMFVPFAVVYFLKTTALPLPAIGLSLSAAGLLALPTIAVSGPLIDRFSSASAVVTGNLVSATAFTCYLTVAHAWQLVTFALLAAAGGRLFWTANLALVGDTVGAAERPRWFAFQRAAQSAGFGLGGLLGAVAVAAGTPASYRLLAVANAASFAVAAALVFGWSRRRASFLSGAAAQPGRPATAAKASRGGYRAALSDRPFLLLAATNFLFVLCMMALDILLTVYLVRDLHQPAWLSGVLFTANTAVVATGQTVVSRAMQPLPPARVLQLAAVTWAASFLLLWALGAAPQPAVIPVTFAAIAVFTAAEMIQGPTLNALVITAAPEPWRGRYLAVYQLSWALGRAAAPSLLTWLFALGTAWPWLTLSAICAAIVVTLSRFGRWIQPAALSQSRPAGNQRSMTIRDDPGPGPERRWLRRLRGNRPASS